MTRPADETWAFVKSTTLVLLIIAGALPFIPTPSQAQNSSDIALDEIIVTARRIEENIQEVPISVTTFSNDFVAKNQLQDISEIRNYTPNLSFATTAPIGGSSSSASVFIRGVGQTDFIITTEPGVGIYIDGAYVARSTGGVLSALDVERIEVLRGPQGTLFGRNTIGGAINVTSKLPQFDAVEGFVEGIFAQRDKLGGRASLNVPISDTLAVRGAVIYTKQDGYGTRPLAGDELGSTDELAGRVTLRWQPSDRFDFNLAFDATKTREPGGVIVLTGVEDPTPGLFNLFNGFIAGPAGPAGQPFGQAAISDDLRVNFGTGDSLNEVDIWGLQLSGEIDLNWATLKSITAYRDLDTTFGRDADGSPLRFGESLQRVQQDQFSQELQLYGTAVDDRLDWQVGAYFFTESATDENDLRLLDGLFSALEALPGPVVPLSPAPCPAPLPVPCLGGAGNPLNIGLDLTQDIFNEIDNTSYAAFGQATYSLTEDFSVTAGIRYTRDEKDYFLVHRRIASGAFTIPPTNQSQTFNDVSGRLGAEYMLNDDVLIYGSIAQGFKSGGFNARPTVTAAVSSFDPETVTAYEVGIKSDLIGNRLRLNGALYYNDYNDIQVSFATTDPSSPNLIFIIDNAAKARIQGFELETTFAATEYVTLFGSVGYTDAEYTDTEPGSQVTEESTFPRTSEWTTNVGAEFTYPIGSDDADFSARVDYAYRSDAQLDALDCPFVEQEGYGLINAAATLRLPSRNLDIGLFGKNLTDEEYLDSGACFIGSFGVGEGYLAPIREVGVRLRWSF